MWAANVEQWWLIVQASVRGGMTVMITDIVELDLKVHSVGVCKDSSQCDIYSSFG
jgi:hypothetical protein